MTVAAAQRIIELQAEGLLSKGLSEDDAMSRRELVDVAKKLKADDPLRTMFEWNDAKAADNNRLDTAGRLLRLKYTIEHQDVRYVSIPSMRRDDGKSYLREDIVMNRSDLRLELMRALLREAESLAQRASRFAEFAPLAVACADIRIQVAPVVVPPVIDPLASGKAA